MKPVRSDMCIECWQWGSEGEFVLCFVGRACATGFSFEEEYNGTTNFPNTRS